MRAFGGEGFIIDGIVPLAATPVTIFVLVHVWGLGGISVELRNT